MAFFFKRSLVVCSLVSLPFVALSACSSADEGVTSSGGRLADTWEWDGTDWAQRSPARSPTPRYGHAMAYDATRGRITLTAACATAPGSFERSRPRSRAARSSSSDAPSKAAMRKSGELLRLYYSSLAERTPPTIPPK